MKIIKCPRCKKDAVYSEENPYRPFCSDRCQTIDLGKWASEEYSVASDADYDESAEPKKDEEEPEFLRN